jgi:hypothetical protein
MRDISALVGFNRGRVSPLALSRVDIRRIALSAEEMTNWMPRAIGSMMLRPGLEFIASTRTGNPARGIPFVFATDDKALVELSNLLMRVLIDDEVIERTAVSTAVTNGTFGVDVSSWTDEDEAGATSAWATGGYLSLVGTGSNSAIRSQQVAVDPADRGTEHGLRIVIQRGPIKIRVGSTSGGDEYISETTLGTGTYSLAVTPTTDIYIQLLNARASASLVDSVSIEAAGDMELPTPWETEDLDFIRGGIGSQSGDVIYLACDGFQQRKIERRGARSWGVVRYEPDTGPFRIENTSDVTLTASAITGDITLASSRSLFRTTHVGALFRLTSEGQTVSSSIAAEDTFTNSIRVTGVSTSRSFTVTLTGTWVGTVTLQRSFDEGASWIDTADTWTANVTTTHSDGLDNQIVFYRIGVKTGAYTSGTVVATLGYPLGSISGVARITGYTNPMSVSAAVVVDLGGTTATDVWAEGAWSDFRGWPTSVTFHEGRLSWFGKNGAWHSVSDAFEDFDPDTEGDSGPISRTIGSGPVDVINWAISLFRLVLGAEGAEHSVRSSSLDEPLTPTNYNIKECSTQGSSAVEAVKADSRAVFVQKSGTRVFQLEFDGGIGDYAPADLTRLCPEIGYPQIKRLAVQRLPDTRVHCMRSDGTVFVIVLEPTEKVLCLCDVETDGVIDDVVILPGEAGRGEDHVYYAVRRELSSGAVRYWEKWALETECEGGDLNKQADSFQTYSGPPALTLTDLDHLEGLDVVVWGDGQDLSPEDDDGDSTTYTVSSGAITLTQAVTQAVIGLPYKSRWKSTKLGEALGQPGKVTNIGFVLANTHSKGLKYGPDFDHLDPLPDVEDGGEVDYDLIHEQYNFEMMEFDGSYGADPRVCLQGQAPRPVTVCGAIVPIEKFPKL